VDREGQKAELNCKWYKRQSLGGFFSIPVYLMQCTFFWEYGLKES